MKGTMANRDSMTAPLFVFDLDGTLEDSRTDMSLSVNRVRRLYELPELPDDLLRTLVIRGMDFLYRSCFPEICKENEPIPDSLKQKYEVDYAAHINEHTALYPGIAEAIQALAKRGTLMVYTNKPEGLSRLLLERLELLPCFTEVLGCDSHARSKPDPAPVEEAMRKHGIAPEERFVIGDSQGDMQLAVNLQATAIWCKWGYQQDPPSNPPPQAIARQPEDLPQILLH